MRLVVLDTETTGMDRASANVANGQRCIEIAAVEILDGVVTGEAFHSYLRSDVPVSSGALKVHGITDEFLQSKPLFQDVVSQFLDFLSDDTILIHNAPFDIAFLDQEFSRVASGLRPRRVFRFVDTLEMARSLHPGMRNDLDSLATRYGVPQRGEYHGAMADATMLGRVYLRMLNN